MACNIVGAQVYFLLSRTVKPKQIEGFHRRSIVLFSVIFSLNIAIGNTSLRWVSVNFNQVCRALVPVIVMAISMFYYKKVYTPQRWWAVIPIVFGVALAFYGDMSFTNIGAFYTILCVVLAALKAIIGGELLTGDLKLHEIDLLSKVCPLALLQIGIISFLTGEIGEIYGRWDELSTGAAPQVVLLSGLLSFSLNVSNFIANKVTSPLTLCIAANVKQVSFTTTSYLLPAAKFIFCCYLFSKDPLTNCFSFLHSNPRYYLCCLVLSISGIPLLYSTAWESWSLLWEVSNTG